jgi:hypothetical protein
VQDLPVALSLPRHLRDEVAAYVEAEAGWQVVGLDGPPPPALCISDAPLPDRDCVVLTDGPADPDAVRAALQGGALDVVAWPLERDRLLGAPGRVRRPAATGGPAVITVAGSRGGVGTSTVTLALAGLVAWAGRSALVVGRDDLLELCGLGPWDGPGAAEIAALGPEGGDEVAVHARPVAGVPGLAVLAGGPEAPQVLGWPVEAVVVDARTALDPVPDVVCARPGPGLARAAASGAPVVLVGEGALDAQRVRAVLGGTPAAWLPRSARVGRAGAAGRVPAGLPGSWLRAVRDLARHVRPSSSAAAAAIHRNAQ